MPIVYLLRRFQCLSVDLDIHQGSIRRNETTASTKVMMDDDDVSSCIQLILLLLYKYMDEITDYMVTILRFEMNCYMSTNYN